MRRRSVVAGLAAAATLGVGGRAKAEQGVEPGAIRIGALGALTGATAFIGGPGRDGLQLAFDAINRAGGVNGRTLQLVFEHAFTPAESVAAAKKLVEQDKVFALVLASGSTGAAAAADYVRAAGVPTYNIFGSTMIIREPFARNVFHGAIPDAGPSGQAMVDYALASVKSLKKIGVLAGTYAFPQANLKEVLPRLQAAGVTAVVEQFDQNARDFTAQLLAFAGQQVPAVIILGSYSEAGYAIRQAPEEGLADIAWVLDGSAVNDAIIPIIGPEASRAVTGYSNSRFFPSEPAPMAQAFRKLWMDRFGPPPQGRPNIYDMVGYGSGYILAEAIAAAGANPTWDSLIEAWSHLQDAQPSRLGGLDVIYPESNSETDHQGSKTLGRAVIRDGVWQVVQ